MKKTRVKKSRDTVPLKGLLKVKQAKLNLCHLEEADLKVVFVLLSSLSVHLDLRLNSERGAHWTVHTRPLQYQALPTGSQI